jgi:hypothetical protein
LALQPVAMGFRQRLAGTVDIKHQHRQRRAKGAGLAARTSFRRALERRRDFLRIGQSEDAMLQIQRVAFFGERAATIAWVMPVWAMPFFVSCLSSASPAFAYS